MKVSEPVFLSEINFFIGWKNSELIKLVKRRDKKVIFDDDDVIDDDASSYGKFFDCDTTDEKAWRAVQIGEFDTIIMKLDDGDIQSLGTLMHECIHAAQCVLEARGVSTDFSEAEPLAYLTEFFFQQSLKYIRDEQIKLDKKLKAKRAEELKKKKAAARKKKRTRYQHSHEDDD